MEIKKGDLVKTCAECGGKGEWTDPQDGWRKQCSSCEGKGETLTEAGEEVARVVSHVKRFGP